MRIWSTSLFHRWPSSNRTRKVSGPICSSKIPNSHFGLLGKFTTLTASPTWNILSRRFLYVDFLLSSIFVGTLEIECCILTLDRAVNQRRTRVNKWKQSRDLSEVVALMKLYSCLLVSWSRRTTGQPVGNLKQRTHGWEAEKVVSGILKITQGAIDKRRSCYGSI